MRSRSLNPGENWELFTLLGIFVVAGLVLTSFWRIGAMPKLWANTSDAGPAPMLAITPQVGQNLTSAISAAQTAEPGAIVLQPAPIKPVIQPAAQQTDSFMYNGHKFVYWETLTLRVTSYAPDAVCCWPYNGTTTASGRSVKTNGGHLVAADTRLIPFNYMVRVPGYDNSKPVPVLDRGEAIQGYRLDVLLPTFSQAQYWGVKTLSVRIYRPAEPIDD
ncbi:MAG TPA: 3D domain-containing protein [Phycisphaerae bacterium]|nr:3D domain-containing protein [Phycisphaerae bacterium]